MEPATVATTDRSGLTGQEACERLTRYGPNAVPEPQPHAVLRFLHRLWGPVPWMLQISLVLQLACGEAVQAAIVATLLLLNAVLSYGQQGRARRAVIQLLASSVTDAVVVSLLARLGILMVPINPTLILGLLVLIAMAMLALDHRNFGCSAAWRSTEHRVAWAQEWRAGRKMRRAAWLMERNYAPSRRMRWLQHAMQRAVAQSLPTRPPSDRPVGTRVAGWAKTSPRPTKGFLCLPSSRRRLTTRPTSPGRTAGPICSVLVQPGATAAGDGRDR
jgi:hypothetical protein